MEAPPEFQLDLGQTPRKRLVAGGGVPTVSLGRGERRPFCGDRAVCVTDSRPTPIEILIPIDLVDARVLAQYAAQLEAAQYVMPDVVQRGLMLLVARRRQIHEMLVAERQRVEQQQVFPSSPVRADLEGTIAFLATRKRDVGRQLHDHIAAHPCVAEGAVRLGRIPGIGPITLATVLAFLPELGTLTRHQIAALVSVAPMVRESGQWRGTRHIYGGRAAFRRVMYMVKLAAILQSVAAALLRPAAPPR